MAKVMNRKQRDLHRKHKRILLSLAGIALVALVGAGGFVSLRHCSRNAYIHGENHEAEVARISNKEHPHIRIKYRKKIIRKRVPKVHVKNATDSQIEHAVKETHREDLQDIESNEAQHHHRNNDSSSSDTHHNFNSASDISSASKSQPSNSNSASSSSSSPSSLNLTNHGGGISKEQAMKDEAQADHSDVEAKY